MSSEEVTCVICSKPGVITWTIDGGGVAGTADLCAVHSKPLIDAVAAAENKPERTDIPEWQKATRLPRKTTRKTVLEPLDWTPPED